MMPEESERSKANHRLELIPVYSEPATRVSTTGNLRNCISFFDRFLIPIVEAMEIARPRVHKQFYSGLCSEIVTV